MISLSQILEEVKNPPKALILAGAPGAGKGFILKGIDLSKHKMEQEEVLLKRNQKYKIKKIHGKNGNIFVDVELI